jgi:hypothetical protein
MYKFGFLMQDAKNMGLVPFCGGELQKIDVTSS